MGSGYELSPEATLAESPIDQALALSFTGKQDAALQLAAAAVQADPSSPPALLLCGVLLAKANRTETAREALDLCVHSAIDSGNLPIAVAASSHARGLGAEVMSMFEAIAEAFGKGSPRLRQRAIPPSLPLVPIVSPLPPTLTGEALANRIVGILQTVRKARDDLEQFRDKPPYVPAVPLLSDLDPESLSALIQTFDVTMVSKDTVVIREGDEGSEAYIVARGKLEARRGIGGEETVLGKLLAGALFGEMALMSRTPRSASVVACRPSILLVARKDALDEAAADYPMVGAVFASHCQNRMIENLMRTNSILKAVGAEERPALIERFVTRAFEPGELLVDEGQSAVGLDLILSGEVVVTRKDGDEHLELAKLGPGDTVGEVSLVLRKPSTARVVAKHSTISLHLPREDFLSLVREHPSILCELYELAIRRDEETLFIVNQEAVDADDLLLI
ncbi:MAG: cyclic nucleotide-binding domain-containing protein [Polyangiaceae bacterium]|nr:cyclic nucleotide-binding domain-containing protein [Polyangiaceae bacterium]